MILGQIIAGALALVWDIENAFVDVTLGTSTVDRAANTCASTNTTASLTHCGMTLSDAIVNLVVNGVGLLNNLIAGLSLTTVSGR